MVDYIGRRHKEEVETIKTEIESIPEYIDIRTELKSHLETMNALKSERRRINIELGVAEANENSELCESLNRDSERLSSQIGIIGGIVGGLIKRLRGIIIVQLDNLASQDWDYSLASVKNIELFNKEFFGCSVRRNLFEHLVNHDLGKKPIAFTYSTVATDRGNIDGQSRKLAIVSDNQRLRYLGTDENGKDIINLHKARYPHGTLRVKRKTAEIMWSVWQALCGYKAKSRVGWAFPLILVENEFQIITPEHLKYGYVYLDKNTNQITKYGYRNYCVNVKNKFNLTEEEFKKLPALTLDEERDIVKDRLKQEFIDNLTKEEYENFMAKQKIKNKRSEAMKEIHRRRKQKAA